MIIKSVSFRKNGKKWRKKDEKWEKANTDMHISTSTYFMHTMQKRDYTSLK